MVAERPSAFAIVGALGLEHAAVDAACLALLFSGYATGALPASLALAAAVSYNLLAFAVQPLMGWSLVDPVKARWWAVAGGAVTALAWVIALLPGGFWVALAAAGLGNAAFHLGGGVVALRLEPGRGTWPGLFVAPGAAGVAAGIALGSGRVFAWVPTLALVVLTVWVALMPAPSSAATGRRVPAAPSGSLAMAVPLLLLVVGLRSYVGAALVMPWKSEPALLVALTAGVVAGKALGGALSDRWGRGPVGIGALVLSLPLLAFAGGSPALGIGGMVLFNMTMPVTLVAVADAIPERPGFAFGLTCLALVAGALPPLLGQGSAMSAATLAVCVAGSASMLWIALRTASPGAAAIALVSSEQEA